MDTNNLIEISRFVDMCESLIPYTGRLRLYPATDDKFRQMVEDDHHGEQGMIVKVYNDFSPLFAALNSLADTIWVLVQTQKCFAFDYQSPEFTEGLACMKLRESLECLEQCIWNLRDADQTIQGIKKSMARTRNWTIEYNGEETSVYGSTSDFINALALIQNEGSES